MQYRWILSQLSHKGSPRILEWVDYSFSRGSSNPGIEPGSPALRADSLPTELPGKPTTKYKIYWIEFGLLDICFQGFT